MPVFSIGRTLAGAAGVEQLKSNGAAAITQSIDLALLISALVCGYLFRADLPPAAMWCMMGGGTLGVVLAFNKSLRTEANLTAKAP